MKKVYVRTILLSVIFFLIGFFVHALFFPYLFNDMFSPARPEKVATGSVASEPNKSVTYVSYTDGQFIPKVVQIRKSYYLAIINMSKKELMWLTSDNKLITTPRGYGTGEELHTILYEPGVYTVSTTLHPSEKLQVIVK